MPDNLPHPSTPEACHCQKGWVCEDHHDRGWPDGCDCGGAGMQCPKPACPFSTPEATARAIASEWVSHDYDCPLAHDENSFYTASSCNCGRINELAAVIALLLPLRKPNMNGSDQ